MPGDDRPFGTRLPVLMSLWRWSRTYVLHCLLSLPCFRWSLRHPLPGRWFTNSVNGLACPYCAYGIEKTFEKTGKTATIEVQIASGFVVLHMKPGRTFTPKRLKQLVANAGFTLKGVQEASGSNSTSGE